MGAILRGAILGGLAGGAAGAWTAPYGKGWQRAGIGAGAGMIAGGFAGKGIKLGMGATRRGLGRFRSWRARRGSTTGPMQGPWVSGSWQGPIQQSNRAVNSSRDSALGAMGMGFGRF